MKNDADILPFPSSMQAEADTNRTTTRINGQRGTSLDPEADPSGEPQQASSMQAQADANRTTTHISGQRGTWLDPEADPSGKSQQASSVQAQADANRPTTRINGQRGTWLDPEADPSGEPQQALRKAFAAWVVNNGCIKEFIKSLRESGYFMVLVRPDAPQETRACADQGGLRRKRPRPG